MLRIFSRATIFLLWINVLRSSAHFFDWIVYFLLLLCRSCLCILEINSLSVTLFANTFPHPVGCLFVYGLFIYGFLCCATACKFDQVSFVYFYFYCLGRLTKANIGMIYVRECFACILFQVFHGVMSYVYVLKPFLSLSLFMVRGCVLASLIYMGLSSFPNTTS